MWILSKNWEKTWYTQARTDGLLGSLSLVSCSQFLWVFSTRLICSAFLPFQNFYYRTKSSSTGVCVWGGGRRKKKSLNAASHNMYTSWFFCEYVFLSSFKCFYHRNIYIYAYFATIYIDAFMFYVLHLCVCVYTLVCHRASFFHMPKRKPLEIYVRQFEGNVRQAPPGLFMTKIISSLNISSSSLQPEILMFFLSFFLLFFSLCVLLLSS